MNCYEQDVADLETKLRKHKLVGKIGALFTLGLFRNKSNIEHTSLELTGAVKSLERFQSVCRNIDETDKDSKEIVLSGVRVSQNTFSDVPLIGQHDYGIDWDILRTTILERDGFQCQESDGFCQGPLQVHHITPLSKGGTNSESNLVTLCRYHHSLKHPHMIGGGL